VIIVLLIVGYLLVGFVATGLLLRYNTKGFREEIGGDASVVFFFTVVWPVVGIIAALSLMPDFMSRIWVKKDDQ